MDLFLLLQSHHEMIITVALMLADGPRGAVRRRILLRKLSDSIETIGEIERRVLSTAARKSDESELLHVPLFACLERHRVISGILLPDVLSADPESPLFDGRLFVLREALQTLFEHEDTKVFPRIAKLFSPDEAEALAAMLDISVLVRLRQS
jgi:hypothetical protein